MQRFHYTEVPLLEVARQMTLIEHDLYRSIQPWEFFKCGWSKADKEKTSPNILAMVQRFNQVSSWVAHEVLRGADPKQRAKRIGHFLDLAKHCEGAPQRVRATAIVRAAHTPRARRAQQL